MLWHALFEPVLAVRRAEVGVFGGALPAPLALGRTGGLRTADAFFVAAGRGLGLTGAVDLEVGGLDGTLRFGIGFDDTLRFGITLG